MGRGPQIFWVCPVSSKQRQGNQRQGSWESRSRGQRCWWQSCHLVYLSLSPCWLCSVWFTHTPLRYLIHDIGPPLQWTTTAFSEGRVFPQDYNGSWSVHLKTLHCKPQKLCWLKRKRNIGILDNSQNHEEDCENGGGDAIYVWVSEWKSLSHVRLFVTPWTEARQALLRSWDSPGKKTGVDCHSLLQGNFCVILFISSKKSDPKELVVLHQLHKYVDLVGGGGDFFQDITLFNIGASLCC